MFYFLQSYLVVLIETICCVIFFEIFVSKQNSNIGKLMAILSSSIISCVTASIFVDNIFIKLILDIGSTAVIFAIYFKEKIYKISILYIVFLGVLWLADFITLLLYPVILSETEIELESGSFLIVILAKLFLFLLVMVANHFFCQNSIRYINEKDWVIFLIMPLTSIVITLAFVKNLKKIIDSGLIYIFWSVAAGLLCINIIMFYFLQNIGKRECLLREKALIEMDIRNQMHLYHTISEKVKEQRELSHEYKNQLMCIQSLCEKEEYEKLIEYLRPITGKVMHDLDYIDTNHSFINAVLNAKYQDAIEKNILFVCKINDLSRLNISSSDVVILLSNLLNNAIEACEKCQGERIIKLKCVYDDSDFVLSIKNTYNGKLNKVGQSLYTTKEKEKNSHGIGLKNVMKIVEKNQGYYAIKHTKKEFYISVIIPQEHCQ